MIYRYVGSVDWLSEFSVRRRVSLQPGSLACSVSLGGLCNLPHTHFSAQVKERPPLINTTITKHSQLVSYKDRIRSRNGS